jgi:alanine racemase
LTELLRALIDTEALRSNLRVIRERAPGARVMAVVKANAYGHGLLPVARALPDVDAFAVARIEEGVALRHAGLRQAVVLLEGVFTSEALEAARLHALDLVVHHDSQLALLEEAGRRGPGLAFTGVVWIKVDTGMNRLGFRPEEFPQALERVRALPGTPCEIRVLTHLARADEPDSPMTARQIAEFDRLTRSLGFARSIANSAGVFAAPGARADWVRPGLALYGVSPFPGMSAASLGLRPAMQFETSVIAVREVPAGESVGYGATWVAPRLVRLAILAAGYGDGVPWGLVPGAPGASAVVQGSRVPIVGRVSMDMVAVDVTALDAVDPGDTAVLWGAGLPVEEVASAAETIPYTLLCGVSLRVPREYLGVPRDQF